MAAPTRIDRAKGTWADRYRKLWTWDEVHFGSHSVDCYPGGCSWRVFVKDGKIVREEQAGLHPPIEPGIPDMNPMGCQKGACWSHCHYSQDRVTHPLKRVGERGKGEFEEVSWDEALGDIADGMLDALEEQGPASIVTLFTPEPGAAPARVFSDVLGLPTTDGNAEFQDFSPGWHLTWGLYNPVSTMDDWFLAELTLIWHANPVYTNIHWYHYLAESRYNGGEIVTIAPDYSPSAIHADHHQPVRIGTDAALALSMCKVIIDGGLYKKQFVQEQTDLPLLIRKDDGRFLRGSDVTEGDLEDQFFWWDTLTGTLAPAPRGTLATTGVDPALEGSFSVMLKDGSTVEVEPVFAKLQRHLDDYTPEKAGEICEIHPDNIRALARKVATRKTKIFIGWNSGKYYHGDLMERSMALLLGLTGNWGKKGTGTRSWAIMGYDGEAFMSEKEGPGQEAAQKLIAGMIAMRRLVAQSDPTMTTEMVQNRIACMAAEIGGVGFPMPPAFMWYYQYGYKERWNDPENLDPSMKRSFDEYVEEAIEKGWWDARYAKTYQTVEPRVLFESGGNVLRRQRGGQKLLLKNLWPKLKLIVSVDYRLTTTGLYSDYVLPAAQHYEKLGHSMPSVHHLNFVLCDEAVEPLGESLPDAEIGVLLLEKIEERAKARGMKEFKDLSGNPRSLEGLVDRLTQGGALRDREKAFDEGIRDNAVYGVLPKGTTLETLREKGSVRFTNWGMVGHGQSQGSTIKPDEVHNALRWHTEDKVPYDTLVRRAQYYIDHEWFLEAGEELPTHKEPPHHGGSGRRFEMTSGHNRWSIHSMNMTNDVILNTHRGEPFVFINDRDAAELGIENGDQVKLVSDAGDSKMAAKLTPSCRPGQVILYNGFEPYMHKDWYSQADLEPGHVKHLGFAAGYGHLQYRPLSWQPIPADRAVRVDVEKLS
ncbi:MAG: molybdopterin-dependent oxidoreductase [Deltaproteobacteria bacterium]|nr:molybdopterin-dependent oxidoreductase [Deltaproteobacteria bacterium]